MNIFCIFALCQVYNSLSTQMMQFNFPKMVYSSIFSEMADLDRIHSHFFIIFLFAIKYLLKY